MSKSKTPKPESPQTITDQLRAIIADAIDKRGIKSSVLATQAGISPAVLHRFMKDKRTLRLESIDKLGTFLGLKLTVG